jgi:hypothetical protein
MPIADYAGSGFVCRWLLKSGGIDENYHQDDEQDKDAAHHPFSAGPSLTMALTTVALAIYHRLLNPMPQWRTVVAHARSDEAVVGGLLEAVRDPSRGAAHREDRRGHPAHKPDHAHTYGQVKIEIGP